METGSLGLLHDDLTVGIAQKGKTGRAAGSVAEYRMGNVIHTHLVNQAFTASDGSDM
jgi:K+-transporting ATPase c subunit